MGFILRFWDFVLKDSVFNLIWIFDYNVFFLIILLINLNIEEIFGNLKVW